MSVRHWPLKYFLVFGLAFACSCAEEGAQAPVRTAIEAKAKAPAAKKDEAEKVPEALPLLEDDAAFVADLRRMPELRAVMADPEKYRAEILFTEVRPPKNKDGRPELVRHAFRVDREYFYPASAIKLTAAVAGLEALAERGRARGRAYAPDCAMKIFDSSAGAYEERDATDYVTGKLNLAHELKKMLVISDNEAFNRMYAFVGHKEMNTRMWKLGLPSVRIRHRLGNVKDFDDPTMTPEVVIVPGDGGAELVTPERSSTLMLFPVRDPGTKVGRAHFENNVQVGGPMDFSEKNRIGLRDLQRLMMKVVLPEAEDALPAYDDAGRALLLSLLSMLPSQSRLTGFDTSLDELQRLSYPGVIRAVPASKVRFYGKSGRAYGFSTENSFVFDPETKRGFFLTAALYTNEVGVVGADHYEYVEIANPFFAALGEYAAKRSFGRSR
jgi:hypothetical protein